MCGRVAPAQGIIGQVLPRPKVMLEYLSQLPEEIRLGIARAIGRILRSLVDFIGPLLLALVLWFALWGQILDRLISKAGFTGKAYRWMMGASLISFIPVVIVTAAATVLGDGVPDRDLEAAGGAVVGLCLVTNWVILMMLAWWPWPSLRKIKGSTPTNSKS